MHKRSGCAGLVAMADRAADDTAQYIAAPFVGWHHAIGDQERARTYVVCNDAQ